MVTSSIRIGGGVVFWSIGEWSELDKLKAGFEGLGLEGYVPEPRTPPACLKDALNAVYPLPSQMVRPLKSKDGFTVVEETKGDDVNEYKTLLTARVETDSMKVTVEPYNWGTAQHVLGQFNHHLGLLRPAQVTASLVKYIEGLGGVKLRPGGGVYWLADHQLSKWQEAASVVEQSGLGKPHAVYLLRTAMDADCVRAVQDAVTNEITLEAESLHKEVLGGELGERALEHRRQCAEKLRAKTKQYEDILGVGLATLLAAVDKMEDAAAAAALLVSCQTTGGAA